MKVTADTITDEQIRELFEATESMDVRYECKIALGSYRNAGHAAGSESEIRQARARCAEIWNARHGGES